MITHSHPHGDGKGQTPHAHPTELWRGLHRNWRAWAVIGLMLAAIGAYVLTLDEAIQPQIAPLNAGPAVVTPVNPAKQALQR
jgi:hypothetical protein